jgi:hypothetical protein
VENVSSREDGNEKKKREKMGEEKEGRMATLISLYFSLLVPSSLASRFPHGDRIYRLIKK